MVIVSSNKSELFSFSPFFSDRLIEQAVGGITVAEIFELRGESFFRDNEVRSGTNFFFCFNLFLLLHIKVKIANGD